MRRQSNTLIWLIGSGLMLFASGCPSDAPVNQAPLADAGQDQSVSGGDLTTLDASGSSDPDGDALGYEWTQTAGESVTLESPEQETITFVAPNTSGTLRFAVTVTDTGGLSSSDTVNITVQAVENLAPVADAGEDQSVEGGAVVTLDATGSSDPDGDLITYMWQQTAGAAVELSADDVASPDFTAPNIGGSLEFELRVYDAQGLSSSDRIRVTITRLPPTLLVTNAQGNSVISFANADTVSGNVSPQTTLAGESTGLAAPTDVLVIGVGALVVANAEADLLSFFYPLSSADGDVAPIRDTTWGLDSPRSMAYSEAQNLVFVSNTGSGNEILVFEPPYLDPSQGFVTGAILVRTITSEGLDLPTGLALASTDSLYVANNGAGNVLVFSEASSADGDVEPERIISSTAFVDPIDVFVNDSDQLFVLDASGSVHIFANASTLEGNVDPASTLSIEGANVMTAIAVDRAGIGYALDGGANAVYVFDDLFNRTGSSSPDRTITGSATGLNAPSGLFLREVP